MKEFLKSIPLSHIAVTACLIKLLISPQPTLTEVLAFFVAAMAYMHRVYENNKRKVIEEEIQDVHDRIGLIDSKFRCDFLDLQDKFNAFQITQSEFEKTSQDTQAKLERAAEELKKTLSSANLNNALYSRINRKRET